jgi:hypothetical protein
MLLDQKESGTDLIRISRTWLDFSQLVTTSVRPDPKLFLRPDLDY